MSGKSHVIKDVKHLDVANAVKSLAIVNENYKLLYYQFLNFRQLYHLLNKIGPVFKLEQLLIRMLKIKLAPA